MDMRIHYEVEEALRLNMPRRFISIVSTLSDVWVKFAACCYNSEGLKGALVNRPSRGIEEIMSAVDLPVAILVTSKTKHEMVNLKTKIQRHSNYIGKPES